MFGPATGYDHIVGTMYSYIYIYIAYMTLHADALNRISVWTACRSEMNALSIMLPVLHSKLVLRCQ